MTKYRNPATLLNEVRENSNTQAGVVVVAVGSSACSNAVRCSQVYFDAVAALVAALLAALVAVDPSVKQNTLNQIKNHSQFKNTNATSRTSNSNLMYTAVNELIIQTMFINLEHVHDCEQADNIKH